MGYKEQFHDNIENIKKLIVQSDYTDAIFECNSIKNEILKTYNDKDNSSLKESMKRINLIIRKYDYDHQDVFDLDDAKEMYNIIINLIKDLGDDAK